ncbi:MAG: ROK family protein [Thermoguttaceae bacterium]|nr:ROK family protein [Thermoguttaceae bacterium]
MTKQKTNWYIGIDVGGTKIQASLCKECGVVVASAREATPRNGTKDDTIQAIVNAVNKVLAEEKKSLKEIVRIGIAVPGVVNSKGFVVGTPNMNLGNTDLASTLNKRLGVPISIGNDGNLGALGESWIGSGHGSKSIINICVGTGIGSGIVINGNLLTGACDAAGEIGHMHVLDDGPVCGCGNHGCFEALAGRLAIERDIRAALDKGEKSCISELMEQKGGAIKSGMLNTALKSKDPLVTRIVTKAAVVIGRVCRSVRHLIDPETIILGGGLMEACGWFLMPIIQKEIEDDHLIASKQKREVVFSSLGDDAVVFGALALARMETEGNNSPFIPEKNILPEYPELKLNSDGSIQGKKKDWKPSFFIRPDGKEKSWKQTTPPEPEDLANVIAGGLECLYVGSKSGSVLSGECKKFLQQRNIEWKEDKIEKTIQNYNKSTVRRAVLFV